MTAPKFIAEDNLNSEVFNIIKNANELLMIVSPFIRFHQRIIDELKYKKNLDKLQLVVLFGKNEEDLTKSINLADLELIKDFPNVEIYYNKRLHSKYYANETHSILTSMNLYDYSQNNNIETGVLFVSNNQVDREAYQYFEKILANSEILFKKIPKYDSGNILGLNKKNIGSIILKDNFAKYLNRKKENDTFKKPSNISSNLDISSKNAVISDTPTGYCIRTGVQIPFNIKMPMSEAAFKSWNKFQNLNFEENYCHFSGEESNKATSFARPILQKNWKKAVEKYGSLMLNGNTTY